ncbi:unnamed protein product [Clavelina lepadiformis]|uniref:NAD(P)-binding domain-containing protein n=1 Tax=Clavelina lepadiformis TaxID=159417 RepID=A0ABP0G983_CLALP
MKTRLLVLGGNGMIGLAVLERALMKQDIEVTAFVRTPSKIPEEIREKIKVLTGNILNPENVADAMREQDAVISCMGQRRDFRRTTIFSQGIKNTVEGMRKHNVKYLQFAGIAALMPSAFKFPKFLVPIAYDAEDMMNYLKTVDDIIWVGVMAPNVSHQEFTGSCKVEENKLPGPSNVTKYDMAEWMVTSITDEAVMEEHKHKFLGISSMSTSRCVLQ